MNEAWTITMSLLTGMGGMICVLLWACLLRLHAMQRTLESLRNARWSHTLEERR